MPRVLVIEDDAFLADIYLTKLEAAGFDADIAINGSEGVAMAQEQVPDAILLDIVMPEMDGFEVLRTLRGNKKFAKTKIILLTNLGQQEYVEKGLAAGADAYLVKAHFTPTEIVSHVQKLLSHGV